MKKVVTILSIALCMMATNASAQSSPIKLFPKGAPGETKKLTETTDRNSKVGGEPIIRLGNVDTPEITIYNAPDEIAMGSAMIVCPGGAYEILAYDLEGTEVCEWLNSIGVTAVLLKYRVPRREGKAKHEVALQDAQRAISYVRANAEKLNIDPDRIGIMGFSAGAHLSAMASNNYKEKTYPKVDAVDTVSSKPNFCLLVYPAYLSGENFGLAPEVKVSADTPPTMIVQAENDKPYIDSSLFYFYALKQAGVPAWLHLYSKGGHGYGLRDTGCAVNEWPDRAEDWMREIGVIE
jgi:acetyl esterase/lipase